MDQSTATLLVIAFLSLLAVFVTVASILILSGGKATIGFHRSRGPEGGLLQSFFHILLFFAFGSPFGLSILAQLSRTSLVSFLQLSPSLWQLGMLLGKWRPFFRLLSFWSSG